MSLVRSGELNRRITLQQRSPSQDSFGDRSPDWQNLFTLWAAIEPLNGRELALAQQFAAEATHRLTVRYQAVLTDTRWVAGLRALYKGRVFNLLASFNENEANVRIHFLASEGLNDG